MTEPQPALETHQFALLIGLVLVILSVFLAWNVRKLQKTAADYYLAGRRVGVLQNASAISADYISAASFLGVGGLAFLYGFQAFFYAYGFFLGFAVVLFFIAGPLRKFGQYTLPDFVGGRFHSSTARGMAIVCVLAISLFYTAPQMLGSAKMLFVLTGIPYPAGVALVTGSITLYVVLGGMRGATTTQIFQFWVLFTSILAVTLLTWMQPGTAFEQVLTGIRSIGGANGTADFLSLPDLYSLPEALSLLLALICGTAGLPHILVRLYTNPDRARARWSVMLVLGFIGAFYLMAPYLGLVMRHLFLATEGGAAGAGAVLTPEVMDWLRYDGQNLAIPAAALNYGGQVGLVIVTAGALAAVLSTVAGLLVVMSSALGHDLYFNLYNPEADERTRVLVARASTVLIGVVVFLLGLAVEHMQIAVLVGLAFAVSASTLFPVLVTGLWWRKMTTSAAIAAMLAGLATTIGLIFAKPLLPEPLRLENPGGIGVVVSFLTIYVVSRVDKRVPEDVDRFMALVHGTMEEKRLRMAGSLKSRKVFAGLGRSGNQPR
jgi:cation/acetate symporter